MSRFTMVNAHKTTKEELKKLAYILDLTMTDTVQLAVSLLSKSPEVTAALTAKVTTLAADLADKQAQGSQDGR